MPVHRFKKKPGWQTPRRTKGIKTLRLYEDADIIDPKNPYDWSHIAERVKLQRQFFVLEYLKDFTGSAALGRMGKHYVNPSFEANKLLKEPYTQWLLRQEIEKAREDTIVTRNEILYGLKREAHSTAEDCSGGSRVAALRALAKIKGMVITKMEGTMTVNGGVMAIHVCGSLDDWEKASVESQKKLKEAVRV